MPSPAPITHAPPLLWAAARALITTLFQLFGDPSRIAAQHTHRKSERTLLLKWLRAGEALLRHLLLIEASHLAAPSPPLQRRQRAAQRARRLLSFAPDKPEDWRVSFRCLHARDRGPPARIVARRQTCGRGAHGPKLYSAWPLAERAEALLRAFNDPAPYARRLARRLHAAPHRCAELLREQDTLPAALAPAELTALAEHADCARARFESG